MVLPHILVAMPVYNAGKFIRQAIDSILAQTFAEFKFLIINDGSNDESGDIARSFSDPRIEVWDQPNSGIGASMNRAIQYAENLGIPYFARMDGDDLSLPSRLEIQKNILEKNSNSAACSSNCYYFINNPDNIVGTSTVSSAPWLIKWEISQGLRGLIHGATLFRTNALVVIGGFRTNFKHAEDMDLFLRLSEQYQLINSTDYLYKIRLNPESISLKNLNQNVHYQYFALDCHYRRGIHRPERDFETFLLSMGPTTRIKVWREVKLLLLWRSGFTGNRKFSFLLAGLLDPRRVITRMLRELVNFSNNYIDKFIVV